MKKFIFCLLLCVVVTSPLLFSQTTKFRNGIFLHHSTGECIWGPNNSSTSVPQEMVKYNSTHGLTGANAVSMTEQWWPNDDNEWATWHNIFLNKDQNNDIRPFLQNNKIIVIKSCFPSSNIYDWGSPADTTDPTNKTVSNYKWHWRSIVKVMRSHPENFFVIWTNAPLVANETNNQEARLSNQFCRWAKDTLATGIDRIFGAFPKNVYVFDFFHKLADSNGKLPSTYAASSGDSHPNANATKLVAPQFVTEIFNVAIAYETTGIQQRDELTPSSFILEQNFPNPFNSTTTIKFSLPHPAMVSLQVFDMKGSEVARLLDKELPADHYQIHFDATLLGSGVYFYRLQSGGFVDAKKFLLIK
ncbi:T9SS type A sorting domain-containing protein [candidate division KSB1 bacterium]|nr:T9SS type A sorting domain-containing protein [candidate division KSB1 bacterium]